MGQNQALTYVELQSRPTHRLSSASFKPTQRTDQSTSHFSKPIGTPSRFPQTSTYLSFQPIDHKRALTPDNPQRPEAPINTFFFDQCASGKRRKTQENVDRKVYYTRLQSTLFLLGNLCTCCLVLGDQTTDHLANDCPRLPKGFTAFRNWRNTVKLNNLTHGRTCFVCYVPLLDDNLHRAIKYPQECLYTDRILPLVWTVFHCPQRLATLKTFFGVELLTKEFFSDWLKGPPVQGHVNNIMAVLLWFFETQLRNPSVVSPSVSYTV